jgi:hypothetical protein
LPCDVAAIEPLLYWVPPTKDRCKLRDVFTSMKRLHVKPSTGMLDR